MTSSAILSKLLYMLISVLLFGQIVGKICQKASCSGTTGKPARLHVNIPGLRNIVKGKPFPSLIDVTLEDLDSGLKKGLFTSVDLVKVRSLVYQLLYVFV